MVFKPTVLLSQSKITNFKNFCILIDKDVLRLDVSVDQPVRMNVLKRIHQLDEKVKDKFPVQLLAFNKVS